jgi:DNA-binding transcriptional regulator of glucitol operon
VWRFVLARRWWVRHLLVGACCVVFVRLGRWQWDRALLPTGGWQNLGYAVQWPLFALALAAGWGRFLWLEQQRELEQQRQLEHQSQLEHQGHVPEANPRDTPSPSPVPPRPASPPIREDDPDDELAAYNAYLARLAEQDRR